MIRPLKRWRDRQGAQDISAAEMNRLQGDIDKANELYRDCLAQGVQTDPNLFWEPMSEYELARWRLDETTNANNSSATTTRKSGAQP